MWNLLKVGEKISVVNLYQIIWKYITYILKFLFKLGISVPCHAFFQPTVFIHMKKFTFYRRNTAFCTVFLEKGKRGKSRFFSHLLPFSRFAVLYTRWEILSYWSFLNYPHVLDVKWKQREKTIFVIEGVAKTEWKERGLSSDS